MLVQNGLVPELRRKNLVHLQAQKTVQTQSFLHGNNNFWFANWFHFSRTATSVLRLFMLEASGLRTYYDPHFSTKDLNLANSTQSAWSLPSLLPARSIQMAREVRCAERCARRLAAEFDRLFPHCAIEYQMHNLNFGRQVTLSGQMYVIYFPPDQCVSSPYQSFLPTPGTIYQINATMDVRKPFPGMEIYHANVHVAVTEYSFNEPVITPFNESEFRRFKLVKELVKEWESSQNRNVVGDLPPMLGNLKIKGAVSPYAHLFCA